jgi:hypothetical protein
MPDDREVHIVCVRPAGFGAASKAEVKVDRPGKRVTLVLGSGSETTWEVTVSKETSLAKVILIGSFKQSVSDLPHGVDRVDAFNDRARRVLGVHAAYSAASSYFRRMMEQIHAMTNTEASSFHGYRSIPQTPILVNAIQADPWLHSSYPSPEPADGLPNLEFNALYFGPLGDGELNPPRYTKFTLTKGPDLNSRIALPIIRGLSPLDPQHLRRLVIDSANEKGYGLRCRPVEGVTEIDLAKQTTRQLPPRPQVPRGADNVSGIAFDVRRQRVLVSTSSHLFAYSPKTEQWEVVCQWELFGFPGLAHDPLTDNLYMLGERLAANGTDQNYLLSRHKPNGERLDEVRLSGPLFSGVVGSPENLDSRTQLIAVGDMLVLVSTLFTQISGPGPALEAETLVYLITPKTGLTRLAWKEKGVKTMPKR